MSHATSPEPTPTPRRKRRRWWLRLLIVLMALILVSGGGGLWYIRSVLNASLPLLNGTFKANTLDATLRIERDAQGVPTIIGKNLNDVAFGLGVLHAQDRFFQMDLLRRKAAGELSAIVGRAALPVDLRSRVHRFRSRMKAVWANMKPEEQLPIQRYCDGVAWCLQQGYAEKNAKPFEYHLLRCEPSAWQPEDCLLCVCAMYMELQSSQVPVEMVRANLQATFPPEVVKFLDPDGTSWDAAIDGTTVPVAPLPTQQQYDLRRLAVPRKPQQSDPRSEATTPSRPVDNDDQPMLGSNNWAVAGSKTRHGGAIICDDMHLGISMPNIWYRACLQWTDDDGTPRRACGVTLPGGPSIVAGSNGYVAWGFTNTEGDWMDLIGLEVHPVNNNQYRTATGWANTTSVTETIVVKGERDHPFTVTETPFGPVTNTDLSVLPYVLRWVAHHPEGVNLKMLGVLKARDLDQALTAAASSGIPHQNFVCGDRNGRIAWTIAGRIPKRSGPAPRGATTLLKHITWDGFLAASDYPRWIDPPIGRIWTANNRVVGEDRFAKLGNGGVDIGHRAGQIRDRLLALEKADEKDMLKIQLDDEARSMQKWKTLFLDVAPKVDPSQPKRAMLRQFVADWDGFARVETVGYTVLNAFRSEVRQLVYLPFDEMVKQKAVFGLPQGAGQFQQMEGPLWAIISAKPEHLLHPRYKSWEQLFSDAVDRTLASMQQKGIPLEEQTWGRMNAAVVKHPLSQAVPFLGHWLDVPEAPLPGARRDLPRISSPGHGASERFAVSPGKEEQGLFHMPGGQSGHPLSPYYRDGHAAWEQGLPTPFLPGPKVNELVFEKGMP
jgi:penicillin amidase